MSILDGLVFVGFITFVVFIGIYMGREKKGKEQGSESYFLAGRGLSWWLIGFSLIAANISTEQFVGQSGSAARTVGFAIVGYEWLAAVTLVIVGFLFLPTFLRCGIYTIPEFLEQRFGQGSRLLMSLAMVVVLVGVNVNAVIFSGAKMLDVSLDQLNLTSACWFVGIVSAIYVMAGGLKACAWADLLQGTALILGGAIILALGLYAFDKADVNKIAPTTEIAREIEGKPLLEKFQTVHKDRLHTIRPQSDNVVPWTALLIGLWIPNLYYWGLNQYIMQRTLGAKSLAHGQGGIVFAAVLKVMIPLVVIFPGMIALSLFKDNTLDYSINMESEARNKANILPAVVYEMKTGTPLPGFNLAEMPFDSEETRKLTVKEYNDSQKIAASTTGDTRVTFKYDADFATIYPADAELLYRYNLEEYAKIVHAGDVDKAEAEVGKAFGELEKKTLETAKNDKEHWHLGTGTLSEGQLAQLRNQALLGKIDSDYNEKITGTGFAKMGYTVRAMFDGFQGKKSPLVVPQKEFVGYDYDAAFPLLLRNLVKPVQYGLNGFVLAAMMGAVMSSLASMLNAASTIFTMDIMKRYLTPKAPDKSLVFFGRGLIIVFALLGCFTAPYFGDPRFGGIFAFIQEFQGFISPGILAIFIFGLFIKRAPSACGIVGMLVGPTVYGLLMFLLPQYAFLNRMAITFGVVFALLLLITVFFPRKVPFEFPHNTALELKSSRLAQVFGLLVLAFVGIMYYVMR